MSRVFLTGGGGFIGGQLAEALIARGDQVVALARGEAAARSLKERGAEVMRGNVLEAAKLADSMDGCEIVHHVAGLNSHCPADPGELWRVNVLGPQNVIHAAADRGIKRVVLTSSAASLGEAHGTVGSESSPHRGTFLSTYEQSKYVGEGAAFAAAEVTGVQLVALNPTSVQGPPRTKGNGAIIIAFLNRRLRAFVETQISVVDVQDVVAAHMLAEHHGQAGRRYVLSGSTLSSTEALTLISDLSGVTYRVPFISPTMARTTARAIDTVFRLRGRTSPLCPARVDTILHGHRYDGSLATRELGLDYTPVADTFRRTIEWARSEGLAPTR